MTMHWPYLDYGRSRVGRLRTKFIYALKVDLGSFFSGVLVTPKKKLFSEFMQYIIFQNPENCNLGGK